MPSEENASKDNAQEKRRGIYPILKSIDERLEIAVKLIGYIGILIISPLVFVFTYIGFDIYSALGIRQLSEYEKSVAAELEAKGRTPDADGALSAIRQGNPDIDKFLLIGSPPDTEASVDAISELIRAAAPPPSASEFFAAFVRSDERLTQSIRTPIESYNATMDYLRANPKAEAQDWCVSLGPLLKEAAFGFEISGHTSCSEITENGLQMAALSELHDALSKWSELIGGLQVQAIDPDLKLKLSASRSTSLDEVSEFTKEAFFSAPEGSVFRYKTSFAVLSPPIYWEQTGAWNVALLEQGKPKLRGGYLPVLLIDAYGPWDLGLQDCAAMYTPGMEQSCVVEFTASVVEGKMQILTVERMTVEQDFAFLVGIQFAQEMMAIQQ